VANLDKYDHFITFLSLFTFDLLTKFCHAYLVIQNFLPQICMDVLTITKIEFSIGLVVEFVLKIINFYYFLLFKNLFFIKSPRSTTILKI